jgi:hypothetical protein
MSFLNLERVKLILFLLKKWVLAHCARFFHFDISIYAHYNITWIDSILPSLSQINSFPHYSAFIKVHKAHPLYLPFPFTLPCPISAHMKSRSVIHFWPSFCKVYIHSSIGYLLFHKYIYCTLIRCTPSVRFYFPILLLFDSLCRSSSYTDVKEG